MPQAVPEASGRMFQAAVAQTVGQGPRAPASPENSLEMGPTLVLPNQNLNIPKCPRQLLSYRNQTRVAALHPGCEGGP